jgi:adenylosuccinate synthase
MRSTNQNAPKGKTTVVVGAQWGNEGKGKLVANLCKEADVCARFNGGANNIHTLSIGKNGEVHVGRDSEVVPKDLGGSRTLVLRLLPLGVINKKCDIVFGNGMVIHIPTLVHEIHQIQSLYDKDVLDRIYISTRSHVVFDFHLEMDHIFEELRGSKIGTTQKGIGPAYSTKTIRNGIRFADLLGNQGTLREKLFDLIRYFEKYNSGLHVDVERTLLETLHSFAKISFRVVDTVALMSKYMQENKRIVCEGANSVMSDIDFGSYPYVTSCNTTVGAASVGLGLPPTKFDNIIGVCKAFTSRTQHWFPSVMDPNHPETAEICMRIVKRGQEVGTTSNKPRRVGWLDLVQVKYAHDITGFDSLMLTKLDALSGLEKVGIVTAYKGMDVNAVGYPSTPEEFMTAEPVIEFMDGWSESLANVTKIEDLPAKAKNLIAKIEQFVGVPILRVQLGAPETLITDRDIIQ